MLCITGVGDEPTIHALGLLKDSKDLVNSWGRKVIVLDGDCPEGLENVVRGRDADGKIKKMIVEGMHHDGPARLPIIAIADSFGRIVYFSEGYNTSLASQLDFLQIARSAASCAERSPSDENFLSSRIFLTKDRVMSRP